MANLKRVNDLLEIETNKTFRLEEEIKVKKDAYKRKVQEIEQ